MLGVPYNADGSAHAVTDAARAFAVELERRFGLPVHTTDERYSSTSATAALVEQRTRGKRGRIRREDIDAAAAAVILGGWLAAPHDGEDDGK